MNPLIPGSIIVISFDQIFFSQWNLIIFHNTQIPIQTFLCRCRISASAYDADLLMSILDQFFHDLVRNTGTIRFHYLLMNAVVSASANQFFRESALHAFAA